VGMIIGVMGQARAGKDTTAEYMAEKYEYVRIGLADPMKRFCKEVFDFSDEQLYGDKRDDPDPRLIQKQWVNGMGIEIKTYLTPRYALQRLGTEWGRDCYNNIWIDYAIKAANKVLEGDAYSARAGVMRHCSRMKQPAAGVVFSDLRFKNEFDAVKKAGGLIIRIKRPGFDGDVGAQNHASEMEQKSIPDSAFDKILDNSGSFEHLYKQIDAIASAI
jgi:hypothetical protein